MDSIPLNHHPYHEGLGKVMTNSSSYSVWNNFFLSAGIPSTVANEYAVTFSQHRIQINMLKEITKEILLDMGIKAMGDIIAILRHAKNLCTQDELKSGTKGSLSLVKSVVSPQEPSVSQLAQRTPITTTPSRPNISKFIGNKVHSRVSLDSGALTSSTRNLTLQDDSINKKLTSTISTSLDRRLGSKLNRDKVNLPEKTLTVRYPSAEAMEKVQQRIAEAASASRKDLASTSIKSRLGTNSTNESRTNNAAKNNMNTKTKQPWFRETGDTRNGNITRSSVSNSYLSVKRPGMSGHKDSSKHKSSTRLKSTVFNRLGEGPR